MADYANDFSILKLVQKAKCCLGYVLIKLTFNSQKFAKPIKRGKHILTLSNNTNCQFSNNVIAILIGD